MLEHSAARRAMEVQSSAPIAGLVSGMDDAAMPGKDFARVYQATVTTTMTKLGNPDSSPKLVSYKLNPRFDVGNIRRTRVDTIRLDGSMLIVEEVQKMVSMMAKKSIALPEAWPVMDLCAVVERLAKGITQFSHYGVLTTVELRGGGNCDVRAIGAATEPIAANAGAVYVSCKLTTTLQPNMLAAFANAISGEGAVMFTDLLGLDALGNILVPDASNAALAQGCYHALNVLGAQFIILSLIHI